MGADVIRRLHLRLLSPRRLGPCRGHIKERLKRRLTTACALGYVMAPAAAG